MCASLVVLWSSIAATADQLPEWATTRLKDVPPDQLPDDSDQDYRTLYTDTHMGVGSDGTRLTRQRTILQIIKASKHLHVGGFSLQGDAKVRLTRAWHLSPFGKPEPVKLPPVDVTSQQAFLTDARARMIEVPKTFRGSLVVFEFEAVETLPVLGWAFDFYDDVEVLESRFELETPPGWGVHTAWLRRDPPPMLEDDNIRSWKLRNLPAPEPDEPFGDRAFDRAAILDVSLEPPAGSPAAALAIPEWPGLASWYERLARGRTAVTPEIQSAAKRALDAPATGFFDKVRAEARYVRDYVRYVDVEIGIGSFQPRPAADTLARLYGDCKDKATLLSAMLSSEGIQAWPVLINATRPETVSPRVPAANAFNHVINAIPIPKDATPPDWAANAVVDAGDLGRLLIVDTTREDNAIGAIPFSLAGKYGLVIATPRGRLVSLPAAEAHAHRIDRAFTIDVHSDRSLDVTQVARFTGAPGSIIRLLREQSEKAMRRSADRRVQNVWVDAKTQSLTLENESTDGAFVGRMHWTVPPLPAEGPESEIVFFPGAGNELPHVPLAQRTTTVDLGFPQTVRYETTIKGLAANVELPDPRALKGDAWSLTTAYAREGATLTAVWEMRLSKSRFALEALPDLKKLYVAIRATADESVVLP